MPDSAINQGGTVRINYERLSKTISHALRHHPEEYALELDAEGWVTVADLLTALSARRSTWRDLSEDDLVEMMARADKQRFEMADGKIRAYYGHSVPDRIEKPPCEPPESLYHGTNPGALDAILAEGLKPMARQYVHLSTDEETARRVAGRRTGEPVILEIRALDAFRDGVRFYLGNDDVWLADPIPARFVESP
jgi:putative RNA 2'-phosphotransferase